MLGLGLSECVRVAGIEQHVMFGKQPQAFGRYRFRFLRLQGLLDLCSTELACAQPWAKSHRSSSN